MPTARSEPTLAAMVARRDELARLLPEWEQRGQQRFEAGDPEFPERFSTWQQHLAEYERLVLAMGGG